MIRILAVFVLALLIQMFGLSSKAFADKDTFVSLKCNKCHTITALGVEKKSSGDEDEDEGEGDDKVPDLSHVGKYHDAAFFEAFLEKKIAHVPHEGNTLDKKHKAKFKGTPEELKKSAEWLSSLK